LQFFLSVVDFGMKLQDAIDPASFRTRHFPGSFYPHGAHPKRPIVEGRLASSTREELVRIGHDVVVTDDWTNGQVCAVRFDLDTGLIEGAASHRYMSAYAVGR
jgi:gamma-glutamyltranspeptidase / glutathione hydrolase